MSTDVSLKHQSQGLLPHKLSLLVIVGEVDHAVSCQLA